jgi:ATP-binding cassette, subfamily A (ABC1), member 3
MAGGRVACTGSSMFLKKRYGVGYTLTIVKSPEGAHAHAIVDVVRGHVSDAIINTNVGNELSLRLPMGANALFPAMLGELEARAAELGISNFGISVTTMEDGERPG